jgi:hypothetical protein
MQIDGCCSVLPAATRRLITSTWFRKHIYFGQLSQHVRQPRSGEHGSPAKRSASDGIPAHTDSVDASVGCYIASLHRSSWVMDGTLLACSRYSDLDTQPPSHTLRHDFPDSPVSLGATPEPHKQNRAG